MHSSTDVFASVYDLFVSIYNMVLVYVTVVAI